MADHMPELTPPWERIPLYITSFQSSPVRIYAKQTTGRSGTWAGGADRDVKTEKAWASVFPIYSLAWPFCEGREQKSPP